MEGILFYKKRKLNETVRVPVAFIENCKYLLDEKLRHAHKPVYQITRDDDKTDMEFSGNLVLLDQYKQKTLYLLIGDKEFLVKDN